MRETETNVLVPREPTPQMLAAAWRELSKGKKAVGITRLGPGPGVADWWRSMLDAASQSDGGR